MGVSVPQMPGPEATSRRLMTILMTDLVGSTAQHERLGERRALQLRQVIADLQEDVVAACGGRVVKHLGDGVMAAFTSALAGIDAAAEIQAAVTRLAGRLPEPAVLRMGLSAGEVTELDDGDYVGRAVIVTARLSAAAQGGEVLVADVIANLVGDELGDRLTDPQAFELKGLKAPVVGWRLVLDDASVELPQLPSALRHDEVFAFVGREAELEALEDAFGWAAGGQLEVALIGGEPGVGKTRLVAEIAQHACESGATVLFGRNDEDVTAPFQPFAEALRAFVQQHPRATVARALGRHRGELVALVPELADLVADLPARTHADPDTERFRLFEAVTGWLSAASADQPIVLVVDDIHWAAKPTLQLLRHLAQADAPLRVLMLGTYRDADAGPGSALGAVIAQLRPSKRTTLLTLAGFDISTTIAFLETAAGHCLDDHGLELAMRVFQSTDGNPLFTRELVLHLIESGIVTNIDGRWTARGDIDTVGIPDGIRLVVGERLGRVSEASQQLLVWAAVVGLRFDVPLLVSVSMIPYERVLDALEQCVTARLVTEVAPDEFAFAHALVRSSILAALTTTRRAHLHRSVGLAIEATAAGQTGDRRHGPGELAHHFEEAGTPPDLEKAVEYLGRAGEQARSQLAFDEACVAFREALSLRDRLGVADDAARRQRIELLTALGDALAATGDPAYRAVLAEAAAGADQLNDYRLLADALLAGARGAMSLTGSVDAPRVALLERALTLTSENDDPERARLLSSLAVELHFADPARCEALGEEAMAMARRLDDPRTMAQVLVQRAAIRSIDTLSERMALSRELTELAAAIGDPVAEFFGSYRLADACIEACDRNGFDRAEQRAQELALVLGQPALIDRAARLRATRLLLSGELDELEAAIERRWTAAVERDLENASIAYFTGITALHRHLAGRAEEALPWWDRLTSIGHASGFLLGRANTLVAMGRLDEAAEIYEPLAAGGFEGVSRDVTLLMSLAFASTIAHELDDAMGARALHRLLLPYAGRLADAGSGPWGPVPYFLALTSAAAGNLDDADAELQRAIEMSGLLRAPLFEAQAQAKRVQLRAERSVGSPGGP